MEHERQLSESLFQPLNNFRNRFCQPCFCYVTHAQSCHRFKIINGENVQYLIFLKQKILASSIDTFHCPCPPHITPPVVNGLRVTMKIFFFLLCASFVGGNTISRGTIIIVFGTSEECGCLV